MINKLMAALAELTRDTDVDGYGAHRCISGDAVEVTLTSRDQFQRSIIGCSFLVSATPEEIADVLIRNRDVFLKDISDGVLPSVSNEVGELTRYRPAPVAVIRPTSFVRSLRCPCCKGLDSFSKGSCRNCGAAQT